MSGDPLSCYLCESRQGGLHSYTQSAARPAVSLQSPVPPAVEIGPTQLGRSGQKPLPCCHVDIQQAGVAGGGDRTGSHCWSLMRGRVGGGPGVATPTQPDTASCPHLNHYLYITYYTAQLYCGRGNNPQHFCIIRPIPFSLRSGPVIRIAQCSGNTTTPPHHRGIVLSTICSPLL